MKIGITGFPASGKTTVFKALAGASVGKLRGGVSACSVKAADKRVDALAEMSDSKKRTYVEVIFVDAEATGKPQDRGLSTAAMQAMQGADALVAVLRGFDDGGPEKSLAPVDAWRELELELILADMGALETRLQRLRKENKKEQKAEKDLAERCLAHLENGQRLVSMQLEEQAIKILSGFSFFSAKPVLLLLNQDEASFMANDITALTSLTNLVPDCQSMAICAQLEMEVAQLPPTEQSEFMASLNLTHSVRERFIQAAFSLLDLICFLTSGADESRAWPVRNGASAQEAASKIHSDIAKGFIRAEVIHCQQLLALGSEKKAREQGKIRLEGKKYIVQDGDVLNFRFAT